MDVHSPVVVMFPFVNDTVRPPMPPPLLVVVVVVVEESDSDDVPVCVEA